MIRKRQSRLSKPQSLLTTEESAETSNNLEEENPSGQPQVYSVSGLTKDIRAILEAAFDLSLIHI